MTTKEEDKARLTKNTIEAHYQNSEVKKLLERFEAISGFVKHPLFHDNQQAKTFTDSQSTLETIGDLTVKSIQDLSVADAFNELARNAGQKNVNAVDFIAFAQYGDELLQCLDTITSVEESAIEQKKSASSKSSEKFNAFKKALSSSPAKKM